MNIFLKEMKYHRKSLIFWSIGVFLMVTSGMTKYEAYSSSGQSINDLIADIPKSLRAVLGFSDLDLTKASGYYGMLFLYLLLMATIHAVMLGATIIAKEERDKTSEFLFVKPVSRSKVITNKLLAAFTNIVIFNLATFVSSIILLGKYSDGVAVYGEIAILMAAMFFLQVLFMVIGSALAAVKKKPKTAASVAAGILLLTYLLSIVIDLNENLEGLRYLTPFKYFEAKNVMYGGGLDVIFVVISVILILTLLVVTYVFYKKRDLNV
ncbi:ABC transporter permease subunit [Peribacillus butanolivorans]|uniref:ABC transporter n=1 Tax=Peribacillus butanolivorans TaxID=421767 RepID=A0AAX0RXN9_9BACI|nr:ABC transporter permease subunit [Peribacillus butanolivorans]PEJ25816.1 ABC transporter [Peribacillus butanolivorans]QNU04786.1 ABC transporter permease [Peribacillus butanolivorans]